jgi:HSP20 family molecular chaperone IbpA
MRGEPFHEPRIFQIRMNQDQENCTEPGRFFHTREYRTMATQIVQNTKETEKTGLAVPVFLIRMRDRLGGLLDSLSRLPASVLGGNGWRWGLKVREEDAAIIVQAEAPGFEVGDFDVKVRDNRLDLCASKVVITKDEKGQIREQRVQTCHQSVTLPSGIDRDKVEAKYHNGVLTVTLPRTAEAMAKKITVQDA